MLDNQTYQSCLLPTGHGYPLWIPEPPDSLPDAYRMGGVRVGDLVILTTDGGYDYLFNIYARADDPINAGRVPDGFKSLPLHQQDILTVDRMHKPATLISNVQLKEIKLQASVTPVIPGIPAEFGGGFEYRTSSTLGGLLVLPEGGSRINVVNAARLRDYMEENVSLWFEHANDPDGFGRSTDNLCLVTGCDKTYSWGVASFSNPREQEISMKFVAPNVMISNSYTWSTYGSASGRASPVGVGVVEATRYQNQCPFIRGFNLSRRHRRIAKGLRICVSDVTKVAPKRLGMSSKNNLSGQSFIVRSPVVPPTTRAPTSRNSDVESISSYLLADNNLPDDSDSNTSSAGDVGSSCMDEDIDVQPLVPVVAPYHPGHIINQCVFERDNSVEYVISHDDAWVRLDVDGVEELLDPEVLSKLVMERHQSVVHGQVSLLQSFISEHSGESFVERETRLAKSSNMPPVGDEKESIGIYDDEDDNSERLEVPLVSRSHAANPSLSKPLSCQLEDRTLRSYNPTWPVILKFIGKWMLCGPYLLFSVITLLFQLLFNKPTLSQFTVLAAMVHQIFLLHFLVWHAPRFGQQGTTLFFFVNKWKILIATSAVSLGFNSLITDNLLHTAMLQSAFFGFLTSWNLSCSLVRFKRNATAGARGESAEQSVDFQARDWFAILNDTKNERCVRNVSILFVLLAIWTSWLATYFVFVLLRILWELWDMHEVPIPPTTLVFLNLVRSCFIDAAEDMPSAAALTGGVFLVLEDRNLHSWMARVYNVDETSDQTKVHKHIGYSNQHEIECVKT